MPDLSADGALKSLQFDTPRVACAFIPPPPIKRDGCDALRLTLSFTADPHTARFPAVRLAYFDPQTRRVEALAIPAAPLTVRDPLREKIVVAGMLILDVLFLAELGRNIWP